MFSNLFGAIQGEPPPEVHTLTPLSVPFILGADQCGRPEKQRRSKVRHSGRNSNPLCPGGNPL